MFKAVCEHAQVPVQTFVNRQDLSCGTTVGPILAAQLACPAVDVGLPMWGMHSAAETMGCHDLEFAIKGFNSFLGSQQS